MVRSDIPKSVWHARLGAYLPQRISWRLALGFGLMVVMMVLTLGQATLQGYSQASLNDHFATTDLPRMLRVQSLSLQTEGVGIALTRLVYAPRENRIAEYTDIDARNRRIDGIIELLATELMDTDQETTLKRLQACRAVYAEAFIDTADEIEGNNLPAATALLHDRLNPALKAMLVESNSLLQRERGRIEAQVEQARHHVEQVALWRAIVSGVAIALAIGLSVGTARSVVNPLTQIEEAAQRIARGDYASRVSSTGTQEVDRVGHALNSMTQAVVRHQHELRHLAFHDPLTDLPNRAMLLQPDASGAMVGNSVALMDLARLKTINETLGYATGDTVIKAIALRINDVLQGAAEADLIGPQPVLARISGGTFALVFNAPDRDSVDQLRGRIEVAMAAPAVCNGHSVDLNLAFGLVANNHNAPLQAMDALLRNAEVALHSAKRAALGFAWYSEAQEAARLGHLNLLSDLRLAVATSQLQMWLQPKFSLVTGSAVGAEALVRWQHPTRGFVSPAEFVPFAEQTGYITLVTDWMLDQALHTLAIWQTSHPELSIAVNVSTRDLQDKDFAQRVVKKLTASRVPAHSLRLEITESGLMNDAQHSISLLHALREIGMPLSIDDFGTGYSSLAYLQQMPVSELKIDRSFIDGVDTQPGTQKLVKAMIEMGHGLDMTVTAEGVETEAERATIIRLGCDVIQGYLTGRPLHGVALQAWFDGLPT
ncbi:putative bifunctional diguanylate cyclase/phosphodiesterase [Actimicrobium antarcticum]|uniref:Diguanylate cyclase (GGDEF) domain-containing protein n=1 Tax=Actimicrobium antarcticum TaxID=1051899 RepID=A0ABP7U1A0_9BURK